MGYESRHIMESLSVQCLQVDDVIPILSSAVYYDFGRCSSVVSEFYKEFGQLGPFTLSVVWK